LRTIAKIPRVTNAGRSVGSTVVRQDCPIASWAPNEARTPIVASAIPVTRIGQ
jgi:hypothetical protein